MGDRHNELVERVQRAIQAVIGDMSVDQATTLGSLELIVEELGVMIEILEVDIAQGRGGQA